MNLAVNRDKMIPEGIFDSFFAVLKSIERKSFASLQIIAVSYSFRTASAEKKAIFENESLSPFAVLCF